MVIYHHYHLIMENMITFQHLQGFYCFGRRTSNYYYCYIAAAVAVAEVLICISSFVDPTQYVNEYVNWFSKLAQLEFHGSCCRPQPTHTHTRRLP